MTTTYDYQQHDYLPTTMTISPSLSAAHNSWALNAKPCVDILDALIPLDSIRTYHLGTVSLVDEITIRGRLHSWA